MVTHQRLRPIFVCFLSLGAAAGVGQGVARAEGEDSSHSAVAGASIGPDVFVHDLRTARSYGSNSVASVDYAAFAIGTDSCNAGDANIDWYQLPSLQHPVIRQGLYRLKNNRFEQIGTSWVKHGFYATNEDDCSPACVPHPGGSELAPNCSDLYQADLNGMLIYLGPSSDINAFTGEFPDRSEIPQAVQGNNIKYRLQARHTDLDPLLNPGAKYFVDGHYVAKDDAAAGNAENNTSHRKITVLKLGQATCAQNYCLLFDTFNTSTQDMIPAIYAWQNEDPTVEIVEQRVPNEGLFILGNHVEELGNGFWRYEYALYNMNSHLSAGSFGVPLPENAVLQNIGFHDVEYHSGEPWDGTDWAPSIVPTPQGNTLVWETTPYAVNDEANALRWSTLYNFRFDVNAPPSELGDSHVNVGMFRPGQVPGISVRCRGPLTTFVDCNLNGIPDNCDVSCVDPGCDLETCGQLPDCNENGVPDDVLCEADCNENGIPDECDIADCPVGELACGDCNSNSVPDGCEDDCDQDGEPDDCELTLDCDEDGFEDCQDLCPCNTPPNGCSLPTVVTCRLTSGFCVETSPEGCLGAMPDPGTPMCGEPPEERCEFGYPCPDSVCRDGCLVGDFDLDGDRDFMDFSYLQECFSSSSGGPAYAQPPSECLIRFDVENDGDVDWADYQRFQSVLENP